VRYATQQSHAPSAFGLSQKGKKFLATRFAYLTTDGKVSTVFDPIKAFLFDGRY